MRKWTLVLLAVVALGGGVLMAADLSNLSGQSCADGGTWHFVNNQTGGTQTPGTLTATFDTGDLGCTNVSPTTILNNVQHFHCTASGTLTGASTDLPGRLQLSDFTCEKKDECVPTEKDPCK